MNTRKIKYSAMLKHYSRTFSSINFLFLSVNIAYRFAVVKENNILHLAYSLFIMKVQIPSCTIYVCKLWASVPRHIHFSIFHVIDVQEKLIWPAYHFSFIFSIIRMTCINRCDAMHAYLLVHRGGGGGGGGGGA
ncbi:hypothetical protein ACJX0J_009830 [Zea mays]